MMDVRPKSPNIFDIANKFFGIGKKEATNFSANEIPPKVKISSVVKGDIPCLKCKKVTK
jgi:hypothetical protein